MNCQCFHIYTNLVLCHKALERLSESIILECTLKKLQLGNLLSEKVSSTRKVLAIENKTAQIN